MESISRRNMLAAAAAGGFLTAASAAAAHTSAEPKEDQMGDIRKETDSLGVVEVPADKLWGAQTQRSLEHFIAVGLLLALNRKIPRAYNRIRDGNFALDGLMGFDLAGRTVAVIGTGKIGMVFARIMAGFGCKVLGFRRASFA
jgi:hypothetical protein